MKKVLFIAILAIALCGTANAADEIKFAWEQPGIESVAGWRLYHAETAGGPYTQAVEIAKTEPAAEYTAALPKADFSGERFFVVRAFNEDGESANSNEVSKIFAPGAPVMLRIILEEAK